MSVSPWESTEPPGLPPGGPAELEAVKLELRLTDSGDDAALSAIVAAVNAIIRRLPTANKSADPLTPPIDREWFPPTVRGSVMLAARLFSRRNSPAGVESFGELGPVYVTRNDPDISLLLEIGAYAPPTIG